MSSLDLSINTHPPTIMHIDLNSCFASVEQQAFPHLRRKPVVVAAYTTGAGCILSPSIEAKKLGIKTGMRVRDARLICPTVIVRDPDPYLVRDVHEKFMKIFHTYSPYVVPKSIDEAIIDFSRGFPLSLPETDLVKIAKEIKKRIKKEVGDWIRCNIGIATNRFLAKLASSLHKPDGLDVIDHKNILKIYSQLKLTDLHGINIRYEARLNAAGIFTPLQFFAASEYFLKKNVFQSIVGYYWYLRLRGWEIDDVNYQRKSFGHEYALGEKTSNREKLTAILLKLCEKTGRRLRATNQAAYGIHLAIFYADYDFWHKGKKFTTSFFTTAEIFQRSLILFNLQPQLKTVAKIAVSCFDFAPSISSQMTLFEEKEAKEEKISQALDKINDRFGEFTIAPALMMGMDKIILDRIAFGGKNLL